MSPDGVYVTGQSRGDGTDYDYATVAYQPGTGDQLWATRHNGPGDDSDVARAVEISPDGSSVYVTGSSTGDSSGADYATVAYQPGTGDQLWITRYNGSGNDADDANALAVSPDSSRVFVTGRSALGTGDDPLVAPSDYATVAYDASGSAESPVFVPFDLRAEPSTVVSGRPVTVSVSVANVGTAAGSYAATLLVDGVPEDSTTIALDAGAARQVEWTFIRAEVGRYELRVGPLSGEFQVREDACPDGYPDDQTIAFDAQDSGVLNRDQGDGCTFLDLVWAQAPFVDRGHFVRAVRDLTERWRLEGRLTRQDSQAILTAAARSGIGGDAD